METSTEYRRFAQECDRLAREAKTERHRKNHAGNGAGLGETRQGDRRGRGRRSRLALTTFFLRVWQVPLACQTKPNLRHVQQGGPGFRVMERARHLQALGGIASTLVGSPHRVPSADLAQRGSPPDVPVASGAFTRFSRALSRRAGRRPVVWGPKCDRDTGGGAPLGDRMSNPARVASRRGSSCAFAEYLDCAAGAWTSQSLSEKAGSTRLGQRSFRGETWAVQGSEQPHGLDDLATVENAHQLGDRQFGVAVGGHKVVGELGLRGAHRVQNCREFVLHTAHSNARAPAK